MVTVAPAAELSAKPAGEQPGSSRTLLSLAAALIFTLVSIAVWLLFLRPNWPMYWHQVDLQVYMWGGRTAAVHPEQLYVERGPLYLPFLYPVFAAWICAELARFPIDYVGNGVAVTTMLALYASVWCTGRLLRLRGRGLLALTLAVGSAALWLEPVQQTFQFGQVSVILMAMVLADLAMPDRWYRGILIGIATGIKLTPAVFIVYLLITRRFKAAGTAIGAFAVTVAIGFWYRPAQAWQFWTSTVASQDRVGFAYVQNQSINGVFGRLQWTTWEHHLPWLIAAGVLAVAGMAAAWIAHRRGDELLGILLAAGVTLLCSPISWTHYWVWVIPALMWAVQALSGRPLVLRAAVPVAVGLLAFAWPMRVDRIGNWDPDVALLPQGLIWYVPQTMGREFHWTVIQFFVGNSYTLLGGAAFLAAVGYLIYSARPGQRAGTSARSSAAAT
ncbi:MULTISPECIES: glycosyltransferase 87 family protein [unclassified Nocardia]|uniref:glycosyltransferase 87 family protein n=1 Tax=unclassified Nocardia TaxID=2637762 RepID=UPI001CE4789C|nr:MULTISPECIES: glycosyltransferase 87 family protein [unclassified Nocardia]